MPLNRCSSLMLPKAMEKALRYVTTVIMTKVVSCVNKRRLYEDNYQKQQRFWERPGVRRYGLG